MNKDTAPQFVVDLSRLALGEAGGLVRIPLCKLGRYVKGLTKFAIARGDVASMRENFRKRANGELVVDYEHGSEMPADGSPKPAAGWLKQVEDEPDERGIWWGLVEFTARAREMIAAGEYKYISPAIDWATRDKTSGEPQGTALSSVGLTNRPFLDMMPAIALSEGWLAEQTEEAGDPPSLPALPEKKEKKTMEKTTITLAEGGQAKVVCGECGKETASAVTLPAPKQPKVIRLSDVPEKDGLHDFTKVSCGEGEFVAGEVLDAWRRETAATAAIEGAIAKGKITPAQKPQFLKMALSDLAGFEELVKTLPQQVKLGEEGIAGSGTEAAAGAELAKLDAKIAGMAAEKLKANPSLATLGQAMKVVLTENPELEKQRKALMRE